MPCSFTQLTQAPRASKLAQPSPARLFPTCQHLQAAAAAAGDDGSESDDDIPSLVSEEDEGSEAEASMEWELPRQQGAGAASRGLGKAGAAGKAAAGKAAPARKPAAAAAAAGDSEDDGPPALESSSGEDEEGMLSVSASSGGGLAPVGMGER